MLLAHYGILEKIIILIRTTYEPSTCQVVHNGSLTEPFSILSGVRQGCLLSPFLFLLEGDWVMASTIEGWQRGIQWTLCKQLDGRTKSQTNKSGEEQDKHKQKPRSREESGIGWATPCENQRPPLHMEKVFGE